jgi:integrase
MARRGQNEGSIFKRADGRWCAQMNLGYVNGKRKRKYFYGDTRRQVQDQLTKALRDVQQGLPVATERLTVDKFLTRWLEDSVKPAVRQRTYESYQHRVTKHLSPALGRITLDKLTAQHVQAFVNGKLRDGLSPRTVILLLGTLHTALERAVRWHLVHRNVAGLVDPPHVERKEVRILTPEQARTFLNAAKGDRLESLYWLALTTGMRRGEILGLRWQDVDLNEATLSVRVQLQRVGGKMQLVEPKTATSIRTIALPPVTIAALKRQRTRQYEEQVLAGNRWQEHDLVFASIIGTPMDFMTFARKFDISLTRAKLPHIRVHDLRHTAATFMLAQGIAPKLAMDVLGHSNLSMTMGTYQHVTAKLRREVAQGMQDLLAGDD